MRLQTVEVEHEVEDLVVIERESEDPAQIVDDLEGAGVDGRILFLQRLGECGRVRERFRLAVAALQQVLEMKDEAGVILASLIDMKSERALDDAADVLYGGGVAGRSRTRARGGAGVDEVERDAGRFFLGELDVPAPFDESERIFSDLGLLLVEDAHVMVEGHVDVHVVFEAFDGEGEMVGEGEDNAGVHEIVDARASEVDHVRCDLEHVFGDILERIDVDGIDVVERPLYTGDLNVIGWFGEADALAERNDFGAAAVEADGDVVVDILYDAHEKTPQLSLGR